MELFNVDVKGGKSTTACETNNKHKDLSLYLNDSFTYILKTLHCFVIL